MSPENSDFWDKARQARDKLANQLLNHPGVSLIDIGYEVNEEGKKISNHIALRVHIRQASVKETLKLPADIEGVPVRVVTADYKLE
jgi:hypothetical protein